MAYALWTISRMKPRDNVEQLKENFIFTSENVRTQPFEKEVSELKHEETRKKMNSLVKIQFTFNS